MTTINIIILTVILSLTAYAMYITLTFETTDPQAQSDFWDN